MQQRLSFKRQWPSSTGPPASASARAATDVAVRRSPGNQEMQQQLRRVQGPGGGMPVGQRPEASPQPPGWPAAGASGLVLARGDEVEAQRLASRALQQREPLPQPPADAVASGSPASSQALAEPGEPLPAAVRRDMEGRFGAGFAGVRVHTGGRADQAAAALGAHAFTLRNHIAFRSGLYDPVAASGRRLLAHELAHVVQGAGSGPARIRRETAEEVRDRFSDWGGLNLREEALGEYLATLARGGQYAFVGEVIRFLSSSDRDDVAGEMLLHLRPRDLVHIARDARGVEMLRLMSEELGSGWTTAGETEQGRLLGAVLDEPGARALWNRQRINAIKEEGGSDLEVLARMFEDELVIDDGTVASRLQAVLDVTRHLAIPGLQTGIELSDVGFAGDQQPGGAGFRDPHPSSRNQPGHFLTAVGLQYTPATVSRPITGWAFLCGVLSAPPEVRRADTVRAMVAAPESMSDQEVALRLTIGHEKAPDPVGALPRALDILISAQLEEWSSGPEGETEEQHRERVGRAALAAALRQVQEIIASFRAQFAAATDADIAAWNEALAALGSGNRLDMAAAEAPLRRIAIDPAGRGNSIQDLRLSLVGWRLGQLIGSDAFADGAAVASWIRTNLGTPGSAAAAPAP